MNGCHSSHRRVVAINDADSLIEGFEVTSEWETIQSEVALSFEKPAQNATMQKVVPTETDMVR